MSKKDSDTKLTETIVEGWVNVEITKVEIDKQLKIYNEEYTGKYEEFKQKFEEVDLKKFRTDIEKFKTNQ